MSMVVSTYTRTEIIFLFSILYLPAFGGSKWLYTDADFEPAKAAECTLLRNGTEMVPY